MGQTISFKMIPFNSHNVNVFLCIKSLTFILDLLSFIKQKVFRLNKCMIKRKENIQHYFYILN